MALASFYSRYAYKKDCIDRLSIRVNRHHPGAFRYELCFQTGKNISILDYYRRQEDALRKYNEIIAYHASLPPELTDL